MNSVNLSECEKHPQRATWPRRWHVLNKFVALHLRAGKLPQEPVLELYRSPTMHMLFLLYAYGSD